MNRLIDANIVLRYLIADIPEAADRAGQFIQDGAVLLPEVTCEVVYVLAGYYEMPRAEICGFLTGFINEVVCPEADVLKTALAIYKARPKLDFVDAILAARHQVLGTPVATFDKRLLNTIKLIDETGAAFVGK